MIGAIFISKALRYFVSRARVDGYVVQPKALDIWKTDNTYSIFWNTAGLVQYVDVDIRTTETVSGAGSGVAT